MKLRHPVAIRAASWLVAWANRLLNCTLRAQVHTYGQRTQPWLRDLEERFLYATWHESLLAFTRLHSHQPVTALVSQSGDGQLLAEFCHRIGVHTVRGSSSHGGLDAVDGVLQISPDSHLLVTPDGPRGPRREIKRGLIYLAAWTGRPIVPLGIGYSDAWRFNSWDRFAVAKPFSRVAYVTGPIVRVPREVNKRLTEKLCAQVSDYLHQATATAERWATTGTLSPDSLEGFVASPPQAKAA